MATTIHKDQDLSNINKRLANSQISISSSNILQTNKQKQTLDDTGSLELEERLYYDMSNEKMKIEKVYTDTIDLKYIKKIDTFKYNDKCLGKLAKNYHYVNINVKVLQLADDLSKKPDIDAIGVLDNELKVQGIIIKKDFYNLLARPFVRDVMKYSPLKQIMHQPKIYNVNSHIFTVAEELKNHLNSSDIFYFVLADNEDIFKGIYSTREMLAYLSNITQREITFAKTIQKRLVFEDMEKNEKEYEIFAHSDSAKGVAGDFYTVHKYNSLNNIIIVGDVCGKGLGASLITSMVLGMLKIYDFNQGLKNFILKLNKYLYTTFESERFITGIFMDYNVKHKTIQLFDIGHSHMLIQRDGKILNIKKANENMPAGVTDFYSIHAYSYEPQKNDIMFIYTDGLIEQENSFGENYSLNNIKKILVNFRYESLSRIKTVIMNDFNTFKGNQVLFDDVTFMLLRLK